jgi:hypothetical protein
VSTTDIGNNPSNTNNQEVTNRNQKITTGKESENLQEMLTDFVQMMFVSGETAEPSTETTTLIEDITRQQVLEIVSTKNLTFKALFTNNYIAFSQHRFGNSPRSALHFY